MAKLTLLDCLSEVEDPRRESNGTLHDLTEVLVIAVCAMLSNVDTFEDIALWAQIKAPWLRRFLRLKNGTPSHDTLNRVFRLLDPKQFESVFRRWAGGLVPVVAGTLAIDGKTVRGAATGGESAIHMVSAFATEWGMVLGQERVEDKSNEITAIPALLDALYIKGYLVSIDAMGCQREIAAQVVAKQGDYLLAVKGNQPSLLASIEAAFIDRRAALSSHDHVTTTHGRLVVQQAWVMPADGIVDTTAWAGCRTLGCVTSARSVGGKPASLDVRYYLSSRVLTADALAEAVRSHWGIENRLHWMLDVNFSEDAATVRKDNAPQNLSLLRKIVLNLARADTTDPFKGGPSKKRKRAAWDDDIRANMLGLTPL